MVGSSCEEGVARNRAFIVIARNQTLLLSWGSNLEKGFKLWQLHARSLHLLIDAFCAKSVKRLWIIIFFILQRWMMLWKLLLFFVVSCPFSFFVVSWGKLSLLWSIFFRWKWTFYWKGTKKSLESKTLCIFLIGAEGIECYCFWGWSIIHRKGFVLFCPNVNLRFIDISLFFSISFFW